MHGFILWQIYSMLMRNYTPNHKWEAPPRNIFGSLLDPSRGWDVPSTWWRIVTWRGRPGEDQKNHCGQLKAINPPLGNVYTTHLL